MASVKSQNPGSGQSNLSKQDLATLDITKLTPLSPEVISRQATINIGTIGHVAHGKSTVVKAVSGVQTVRFKNELERNITIKLDNLISEMATRPEDNSSDPAGALCKRGKKRKRQCEKDEDEDSTEEFIVEAIIDHEEHNGRVTQYFVKWEGWKSDDNTWEPFSNLESCLESVVTYFECRIYGMQVPHLSESRYLALKKELSQCTDVEMEDLSRQYFLNSGDILPNIDENKINATVHLLARLPVSARDRKFVKKIRHQLLCIKLKELRKAQLAALSKWQDEINLANFKGSPKIEVYNCVDLTGPPSDFIYVNNYIPGFGVEIDKNSPIGCNCSKRCFDKCAEFHGSERAYKSNGLLRVERGTPIFECNISCKCSMECENRVVQKGTRYSLCIFRTHDGRGWGVKALEPIPKGAFVSKYAGEIITVEEAERRGKNYDREGFTYLFDLDFNDKVDFPYTVDAKVYGNISHFINHSCSPNLEVFAVWINCLDPNIPLLCLFASRNIKQGEELSFDYLCQPLNDSHKFRDLKKPGANNLIQKVLCKCGSQNCRKFLF